MKNILIAVLLMLAAPLIFAQSLPVGPKSFTGFCPATSGTGGDGGTGLALTFQNW
jgi:hypothetical protein